MMKHDDYSSRYQDEWSSLFSSKYYLERLKPSAIKGTLKASHFRSVCWKVFLECLPENRKLWIDTAKSQRQKYEEILDKFDTNPRNVETLDINVNNPLSQSHQSPWNQYFQDSELKGTIEQDVVRTFPEIEFFRTSKIQNMMINILFSYAREFPHISYKQGMHELLAPILFVLHYDQQAYLQASETDSLDLEIHILLNQNYIEHDAFFLFCHLMEGVETWYSMNEYPYSKYVSLITEEPFSQNLDAVPVNTLGRKLKRIYQQLLKHHDTELFLYFEQMEITPQIFGIRWLRLLFGREFSVHDLLIVWDAIFSDSTSFDLVDYIFVAMLISIRELLLQGDFTSCLSHLMRFPNVMDVQYIIDLAFHLRDPDGVKKPEGSVKILNPLQLQSTKESKHTTYKGFSKNSMSTAKPAKAQTISNKRLQNRPKSLSIAGVNKLWSNTTESSPSGSRSKSSSLSERNSNVISSDPNESDHSSSDFLNEAISSNMNIGASATLPRTSIRNVMESRNHKFRAADLTQTIGPVRDKKSLSEKAYRELVPLVPASSGASHKILKDYKTIPKDASEEIKVLKAEMSNLRAMNEYCTQQITQHLEKLQDSMMHQRLQNEDELFLALAGLKRARDILKGTVSFTEEVICDDISSYCVISQISPKHSSEISIDNQENCQTFEVVEQSGSNSQCNKNESFVSSAELDESPRKDEKNFDSLTCKSSNSLSELQNISNEAQDVIAISFQENFDSHFDH